MSDFDTTVPAPRTRDQQRIRIEEVMERRHLLRPTPPSITRAVSLLYTWEHVAAMCGISSTVLDYIGDFPGLALEACYTGYPGEMTEPVWPRNDATERAISGELDAHQS